MRSILSIIALFSCCTLAAQEYIPTYGRELPRGEVIAFDDTGDAIRDTAYIKTIDTAANVWKFVTQQKAS